MFLIILPVHVVVLHSWVWLVFAIETGLLQGKTLQNQTDYSSFHTRWSYNHTSEQPHTNTVKHF